MFVGATLIDTHALYIPVQVCSHANCDVSRFLANLHSDRVELADTPEPA